MKPIIRIFGVGLAGVILFIGFGSPAMARQLGLVPKAIVGAQIATDGCTFEPCTEFGRVTTRFDGLVGVGLESRLWGRFSAEVDAIYKPREYQVQSFGVVSRVFTPTSFIPLHTTSVTRYTEGHSWDFPVMLKVKWAASPTRTPYVLGGFVASRTTGTTSETVVDPILGNYFFSQSSESLTQTGIVLGGGVAWKLRRVQLFPEGRYTEWLRKDLPGPTRVSRTLEFVLGISLGGK